MLGYEASTYGDGFAEVYDSWYPHDDAVEQAVATIADLAQGGPVLELGCGTGRLLLPVAGRGLGAYGLDASQPMLDQLQQKPGAANVITWCADMAQFELTDAPRFALVFCAFNTFFNLPTLQQQQSCLHAVAAHLLPSGRLALECFVPGDSPPDRVDQIELRELSAHRVILRVSRQDPANQTVSGQHIEFTNGGVRLHPWHLRYAPVAEIDELAIAAGLVLQQRWASWDRDPFTSESASHVSVYRKAGKGPAING